MLFTDQPPAYPYHDKPPDYHDVWPRTTVSPPPVDIPPPDSTPAVHIPLTTTNDVIFSPVYSSYATTTTTIAAATTTTTTTTTTSYRYPHENVVVTQSHTHNSHPNDVNEVSDDDISNSHNRFLRLVFIDQPLKECVINCFIASTYVNLELVLPQE